MYIRNHGTYGITGKNKGQLYVDICRKNASIFNMISLSERKFQSALDMAMAGLSDELKICLKWIDIIVSEKAEKPDLLGTNLEEVEDVAEGILSVLSLVGMKYYAKGKGLDIPIQMV